jgi:phosphate transport system protein
MNAQPASHRHFHDELSELKVSLLNMSGDAQAALAAAVDAVLTRDGEKAVIAGDTAIDQIELDVEERVIRLLATQQPMARDLRFLTAAMKIANDLERVGDHAVNIAQSAERMVQARPIIPEPELLEMARQARTMLADALDAFVRGDAQAGRAICRRDDSVDALHASMFRILRFSVEDPHHRHGDGALPREPESRARGRPRPRIAEDVVFFAANHQASCRKLTADAQSSVAVIRLGLRRPAPEHLVGREQSHQHQPRDKTAHVGEERHAAPLLELIETDETAQHLQ